MALQKMETIYNFKNNISTSNIHYDISCNVEIPMKKKVEVYFSTGNKGVYLRKTVGSILH